MNEKFVAVKKPLKSTADAREETIHEANIMAELKHPNIINFCQACHTDDSLWIVTDIAKNGSLDNFLKNKNLKYNERINISKQVVNGMEYLHQKGICHIDLAARNVLVDWPEVKISDFGLAQRLNPGHDKAISNNFPLLWTAWVFLFYFKILLTLRRT